MTPSESSRVAAAARWATRIADLLCSGPVLGLLVGLGLFVHGALSLGNLSYFGETSAELKQLAIQVYGAAVAREHLKILALYLALGMTGGLFASGLCALRDHLRGRGSPVSRLWRVGRILLLLFGLHFYFLARSMVEYPQLYSEAFYDRGGFWGWLQVALSDHFSPGLLDGLLIFVLGAFVLLPVVSRIRAHGLRWRRPDKRQLLGTGAAAGLVCAALITLALATGPSKATHNDGPNILIIAVDSLRQDRMMDPAFRQVAPRLHRVAKRGVCFERAYGTLARTFPSWVTLLTGQEPHTHGIRHMFPTWKARGRTGSSLPSHLRRAGWETAVVSDYAGEIFARVQLGFHHVDVSSFSFYEIIRQRVLKAHTHLMPYLATATGRDLAPPMRGLPENGDPRLLARKVNRMLTHVAGHKRFFMVAFFSAAHFPYAAPYPYYRRFTKRGYRGRYKYLMQHGLHKQAPNGKDIQQIRGLYNGAVSAGDAAIGLVLDHLKRLGIDKKTIVVLTADHGENIYEGTLGVGHGDHLRGEMATRLPLVIYDPVHKLGARRIRSIVRDVDLAPTLAALVGRPLGYKTAGRTLVPLMRGAKAPKDRAAFAETGLWFTPSPEGVPQSMRMKYPPVLGGLVELDQKRRGDLVLNPRYETLAVAAKHRSIRTEKWKLIYVPLADRVRYLLFDVQKDPHCDTDVSAQHPKVTARLKKRLSRWMLGERGSIKVGDYVLPGQ